MTLEESTARQIAEQEKVLDEMWIKLRSSNDVRIIADILTKIKIQKSKIQKSKEGSNKYFNDKKNNENN